MILILRNGYPFPYPSSTATDEDDQRYAEQASGNTLTIHGVQSMEWLHELTLSFESNEAFHAAREQTGWTFWDNPNSMLLVAPTSAEDGYDHPAIVVRGTAYCGFYLGR